MKRIFVLMILIFLVFVSCNPFMRQIFGEDELYMGSGTLNDPFRIYTFRDLEWVGKGENYYPEEYQYDYDYSEWNLGASYILMVNITLPDYPGENFNWMPIGDDPDPFTGTFDGNDKTIFNMTINTERDYVGMFAMVDQNAVIKNLKLSNCNINTSGNNAGGIAGLNKGTIQNCSVTGFTESSAQAGGIVGDHALGLIENCSFSGDVKGMYAGGIAGYVGHASVINCSSTGSVVGEDYAGGIVGNNISGSILGCEVLSQEITRGENGIGRIVGANASPFFGVLSGNRASSNVTLNEEPLNCADCVSCNCCGDDHINGTCF